MTADPLTVETRQQEDIEIITLSGPLTLSTLFTWQEAAKRVSSPKTVVDLSGVPYMDSAGLGSILSFHAASQRARRNYALVGVAPRVMTMFEISRVHTILRIFANYRDAEHYLGSL